MTSKYNQWKKIEKYLANAAEMAGNSSKREAVRDLLLDAYELWREINPHAHKDDADAKNLYSLREHLLTCGADELEDAAERIEEIINQALKHKEAEPITSNNDDKSDSDEDEEKAVKPLKKDTIKERIADILDNIDLKKGYYGAKNKLSKTELKSAKWKTYFYLRKCVLDYGNGNKKELLQLIAFLEKSKKNKKWLAGRLLDKTEKEDLEKWGSGKHEWLERCLIVDVLKRSAGMVKGVQAKTDADDDSKNIDWLYLQAMLRSPTKYIFFKDEANSIKSGHPGAVKKKLSDKGFATKGSPGFHEQLVNAFNEATTLAGFIIRANNIFKTELHSGKKRINASKKKKVLVDNTKTNDEDAVNKFRKDKLRPGGYDYTNRFFKKELKIAAQDKELDEFSETSVESETTETSENPPPKKSRKNSY